MPVRVTEVLDYFKEPWYIDWVCRVGKAEAKKTGKMAMAIGSRVDELIKTGAATSKKDSVEVNTAMQAFDKWKAVYQPKVITNGTRLYANIGGVDVSGEPDIFVDGVLVDIKCATKISLKYWIQVNVYATLGADITLPTKVAILRLDKKTGGYEYQVGDYDKSLFDVWCGMLRAMLYLKGEEDDGDEL